MRIILKLVIPAIIGVILFTSAWVGQEINTPSQLFPLPAATPTSGGSKIAFVSIANGRQQIFVMDSDGSNRMHVPTAGTAIYPQWSPDGTRLLFQSYFPGEDASISIMYRDGSNLVTLVKSYYDGGPVVVPGDNAPAWSPDGSKIIFRAAKCCTPSQEWYDRGLYVMDADGSNISRLTTNSSDRSPAWSPDGTKIAFNRAPPGQNQEIYIMNADGSNITNITNSESDDVEPDWSPDDTKIAFQYLTNAWVMNADGSNRIDLNPSGEGDQQGLDWSPDGTKLTFTMLKCTVSGCPGQNLDIWIMDNDGSNRVNISNHPASDSYSDWSPGVLAPLPVFTSNLSLPSGWINTQVISASFSGMTARNNLAAGSLSNDGITWGDWITATENVTETVSWNVGDDGADKPVYLRLRDTNWNFEIAAVGTIQVDTTSPTSTMSTLPLTSPSAITLTWSSTDNLSGSALLPSPDHTKYDVQVRTGVSSEWTIILTNTTLTSTIYNGVNGVTYYFRVRAKDAAGNIEDWPTDYGTYTLVDMEAPTGTIAINNGALATTSLEVDLVLSASDGLASVVDMQFSNDGDNWAVWQSYTSTVVWSLTNGDGVKNVSARFRDTVGNMSDIVSDTIELDTDAGSEYGITINDGDLFTNQTPVTLTIGARVGTTQMQVSNDGSFAGVDWEPYASRRPWEITQYGNYVIPRVVYLRYKDGDGNVSASYQDDIILDVTPPTGTVSLRNSGGLKSLTSSVTLVLEATDDVSGVGEMLVSNQMDFVGTHWQSYVTNLAWTLESNQTVYVKFRDNAGNISQTYSASPRTFVYLPVVFK